MAYTRLRDELVELRNQHNNLQAQLAPRTRTRALKSMVSGPLDASISHAAKKYAFWYHLWVPNGAFPLSPCRADFDFNHPLRYCTTTARTSAYNAEIYLLLPPELGPQATKYEQFEQLVSR